MSAEVSSQLAVVNDCDMGTSSLSSDHVFSNIGDMHPHLDNVGSLGDSALSAAGKENSTHPIGPRPLTLKSLDIFRQDGIERHPLGSAGGTGDFPDYMSTANESVFSQPSHIVKAPSSGTASMKKRAADAPYKALDQIHNTSRTGGTPLHLGSSGSLKKLSRNGTIKGSQGTSATPLSSPKRTSPPKGSTTASPKSPFHPPGYHTARRAELRALLERQKCEQEQEETKLDRRRPGISFDKFDQKCASPTLTNASLIGDSELSMLTHSMELKSPRASLLKNADFIRSKLQESSRSASVEQKTIAHSPGGHLRDLAAQRMKNSPVGLRESRSLVDRASLSSPSNRRVEVTMSTVKETNETSGDENSSDYGTMDHHRSKGTSSMSLDAGARTPNSFVSGEIVSPERASMNEPKPHPAGPVIINGQPMFISDPRNDSTMQDHVKMNLPNVPPLDLHPFRDHNGVRLQRLNSLICHPPVPFALGGVFNSDFGARAPAYNNIIQSQLKQPNGPLPMKMESYVPFAQKPNTGFYDSHILYPPKTGANDAKSASVHMQKERPVFNPNAAAYVPMTKPNALTNPAKERLAKLPPVSCKRISSQLKPGNITVLHTQNGYTFKSYFCPDNKRVNCKLAGIERNPYATCRAENWDLFARNALGTHGTRPLNRTISPDQDLVFMSRSGTCVYSSRFAHSAVNVCVDYNGKKFAIIEFDD